MHCVPNSITKITYFAIANAAFLAYGLDARSAQNDNAGGQAHAGKAVANSGIGSNSLQPIVISMNCTRAYMPISEAGAAVLSNDVHAARSGNYSTVATRAACKGPTGVSDTLCDVGSCADHPVCYTCSELIITGRNSTAIGYSIAAEVTCANNYFFGTKEDAIRNICTDGNDKTWTCSGGCTRFTSCQRCVSMDDPAYDESNRDSQNVQE